MKKSIRFKILNLFSSVLFIFNSFYAPLLYALPAYAQTTEPEAVNEQTPPATEVPAAEEQTQTVEEVATPTPEIQASIIPSPSTTPLTPPEPQTETDTTLNVDVLDTEIKESETETQEVVLEPDLTQSIEESPSAQLNPSITTDKADYAPTDTVLINGTGFQPNTEYQLVITSDTGNYRFEDRVSSDESGAIFYTYQLDGTYRPDYLVEIYLVGDVVSYVTFTDAPIPSSIKLSQWETLPSGNWVTGNLGSSNSNYKEGESIPFQLDLGKLNVSGNPYVFSVCRDYDNVSKRGYLFLTPYDISRTPTISGSISSSNGPFSGVNISSITYTEVGGQGACNAGQRETQVSFVVADKTKDTFLYWGGHLASPIDSGVGPGNGAASYPGSSLAMTLLSPAKSLSINPGAIIQLATITVQKIVNGGTALPEQWGFSISPNPNNETLPKYPSSGQDTVLFLSLNTGSYQISETSLTGYSFLSGNGTNCTFSDGVATATVTAATDATNAVCIFTNTQQQGKIQLIKDFVGTAESVTINIGTSQGGSEVETKNISADGSTNENLVNTGTYYVSESLTNPTNYQTQLACFNDVNDDDLIDAGDTPHSVDTSTGEVVIGTGDDVICRYTNTRKTGTVKVKKVMVGGTDTFDFTGTPSGSISSDNGTIQQTVDTGQYTSTESAKTGWDLNSITCDDTNSTGDISTRTATFNVGADEVVTCTFTNTKRGSIVVEKQTDPDAASGSFTFTGTASGTISDNGQIVVNNLVPGGYSSTENDPTPNYDLTSIICDDGQSNSPSIGDVSTRTASFNVDPGENVTCVFTNTQRGSISGYKYDASTQKGIPGWKIDLFACSVGQSIEDCLLGTSVATTTTDSDGAYTFSNLIQGLYAVAEELKSGYVLVSSSSLSASVLPGIGTTGINFYNVQQGKIIVEKQTSPDADSQIFDFTTNYSGGSFSLSDGQQNDSGLLTPTGYNSQGTYSVSETAITGWELSSISCNDDDGNNPTAIVLDPGETVTCTFNNTKKGKIIVEKQTIPNGSSQSFDFTPSYGAGGFSLTDGQQNDSGYLVPGTYSVSETEPTGWDLTNTTCSDGSQVNSINLSAGETVTCTFTNTQRGNILIDKVTTPSEDPQSFSFTPSYGESFNLKDTDNPNNSGTLVPGTYTVSETVPSGWDLTNIVCSDLDQGSSVDIASKYATIDLDAGETITCTFTNTKRGSITITKDVTPNDSSVWDFTLIGTGVNLSRNDLGDGQSHTFGNLLPQSYDLTEITQAGYTPNIVCDDVAGRPGSNGYLISLAAGQEVTCLITNTRDSGSVTVNKLIDDDGNGTFESGNTLANQLGFKWTLDGGADNDMGSTLSSIPTTVGEDKYSVTENLNSKPYHLVGWYLGDGSCDNLDGTSLSVEITVSKDQTTSVTFCNARDTGSLVIQKVIDEDGDYITTKLDQTLGESWEFDVDGVSLDEDNPSPALTDDTGVVQFSPIKTGSYNITETLQDGYDLVGVTCPSGTRDGDTIYGVEVPKESEFGSVTCIFYNSPNGVIHGRKWNDFDGNEYLDGGEELLGDWTINLYKSDGDGGYDPNPIKTMDTVDDLLDSDFGWYLFENLFPGDYKVCEVLKDGWSQTYPSDNDGCHLVSIPDENPGSLPELPNAVVEPQPAYDFGNFELGELRVCKYGDVDGDRVLQEQDQPLSDVTIFLEIYGEGWEPVNDGQTEKDGCITFGGLEYGYYRVSEEAPTGYYQTYPLIPEYYDDILVESGFDNTSEPFIFMNAMYATLGDFVWEDSNGDGIQDPGEVGISGIDVYLYKDDGDGDFEPEPGDDEYIKMDTTDGLGGSYLFENLIAGAYWVDVDDATVPAGYAFTTTDPYLVSNLLPDDNYEDADFGLVPPSPSVTIEKSNNKSSASAGDTVTYTLKVKNTGNITLNEIEVTDILPAGFSYVAGSATPDVYSVNGQILIWHIDSMVKDEEVVITYDVKISSDQKAAKYTNLAVCKANYGRVFDNQQESRDTSREVLGGTIGCNDGEPVSSDVSLGLSNEYGGFLTGQVLGAATELPATGSPTVVLMIILLLLAVGLILRGMGKTRFPLLENLIKTIKKSIKLSLILFVLSLGVLTVNAKAVNTTVDISDLPEYTNRDSFTVSYTAISDNPGAITAQFYYMKDGGSYTALGGVQNGPSNKYDVTSSVVNEGNKKYFFKVVLGSGESNETSTIYDNSGPDAPGDFSKERLGSTTYKIKWHTPNNDDFAQVVIYRGESLDFDANSEKEVARVGGDKDKNYEWVDNGVSGNKDYYYRLRALDKAGNSSGLVGDVNATITQTTQGQVAGASTGEVRVLPKEGEGQVLSEETEESVATPEAKSESGETNGVGEKAVEFVKNKTKLTVGIAFLLGIIAFFGYRYFKNRNK